MNSGYRNGKLCYVELPALDIGVSARSHADAPEATARFQDPAGNILGLFQEPTLAR